MTEAYRRSRQRYNKERYDWLKERGYCVTCGHAWAEPGRCRCKACAKELDAMRARNYGEWYAGQNRLRAARIEAGLCITCGAPAAEGRRRCPRCLANRRDYQRCYAIEKKTKQARGAEGGTK